MKSSAANTTGHTDVSSRGTFKADRYSLTETRTMFGYTNRTRHRFTNIPYTTLFRSPVVSNTITLANGDSAICTIINNDNPPSLVLDKIVTNDNGGTAENGRSHV